MAQKKKPEVKVEEVKVAELIEKKPVEEVKVEADVVVKTTPAKTEKKEVIVMEPTNAKEKMVSVTPMETFMNTYIGGKYYNLVKGESIKVTPDAERVLRERDMIR